jgi:hypothetical protein
MVLLDQVGPYSGNTRDPPFTTTTINKQTAIVWKLEDHEAGRSEEEVSSAWICLDAFRE